MVRCAFVRDREPSKRGCGTAVRLCVCACGKSSVSSVSQQPFICQLNSAEARSATFEIDSTETRYYFGIEILVIASGINFP